jgi:hypothetical protein
MFAQLELLMNCLKIKNAPLNQSEIYAPVTQLFNASFGFQVKIYHMHKLADENLNDN